MSHSHQIFGVRGHRSAPYSIPWKNLRSQKLCKQLLNKSCPLLLELSAPQGVVFIHPCPKADTWGLHIPFPAPNALGRVSLGPQGAGVGGPGDTELKQEGTSRHIPAPKGCIPRCPCWALQGLLDFVPLLKLGKELIPCKKKAGSSRATYPWVQR